MYILLCCNLITHADCLIFTRYHVQKQVDVCNYIQLLHDAHPLEAIQCYMFVLSVKSRDKCHCFRYFSLHDSIVMLITITVILETMTCLTILVLAAPGIVVDLVYWLKTSATTSETLGKSTLTHMLPLDIHSMSSHLWKTIVVEYIVQSTYFHTISSLCFKKFNGIHTEAYTEKWLLIIILLFSTKHHHSNITIPTSMFCIHSCFFLGGSRITSLIVSLISMLNVLLYMNPYMQTSFHIHCSPDNYKQQ